MQADECRSHGHHGNQENNNSPGGENFFVKDILRGEHRSEGVHGLREDDRGDEFSKTVPHGAEDEPRDFRRYGETEHKDHPKSCFGGGEPLITRQFFFREKKGESRPGEPCADPVGDDRSEHPSAEQQEKRERHAPHEDGRRQEGDR